MARKSNLDKSIEISFASSILYYDKEELDTFFPVYDQMLEDTNNIMSGNFYQFVSYMKKIKEFKEDPIERRNYYISKIIDFSNLIPDSNSKDNFQIWFEEVQNTEADLDLSEDIFYRYLWEQFKLDVDRTDRSTIPFKEKLSLRPKIPQSLKKDGIINLDDIDIPDESNLTVYTTGLEDLDRIVRFTQTNFVVIAARPGVGKSLAMLEMAIANARQGVKTLYLSLEMSGLQILGRVCNSFTRENIKEQHTNDDGTLNNISYKKALQQVMKDRNFKPIKDNLQLSVTEASSAESILQKLEDQIKEFKYEAIFIDYLQLLRYKTLDEWASLRNLTNSLKNLAFRENVLIVTGSQVSRSSTEKGLYLSDLFGSSSIEADTDIVIGLESTQERRQGDRALVNIKILKNREGDLGEQKFYVDYSNGKLTSIDN